MMLRQFYFIHRFFALFCLLFMLATGSFAAYAPSMTRSSNVPYYSSVFDMVLKISTPQGTLNKAQWRRELSAHPDMGGTAAEAAIVNAAKSFIDNTQSTIINSMRARAGISEEQKAIMVENAMAADLYGVARPVPRTWTAEELEQFRVKIVSTARRLANMEDVIHHMLDVSSFIFNNRMSDISQEMPSGDRRYHGDNFWVKGSFGNATFRPSSVSNVNSRYGGFTLGCDAQTSDNNIIGLAYTKSYAEAKVKEASGIREKTSANIHMFSLYGRAELVHEIFTRVHCAYGLGKTSLAVEGGKHSISIIKGSVDLGYRWRLSDRFAIFPSLGISYDNIAMPISTQNMNETQKLSRVWGKFSTSARYKQEMNWGFFVYDIHAGISNIIARKTNMKSIDYEWVDSSVPKLKYNIGTHIGVFGRGSTDVRVGYDICFLQKGKSRSQDIWVKLEIKL